MGSEPCKALLATSAYAHEQHRSSRLPENTSDARDMLHSFLEKDEVKLGRVFSIVFVLISLERLLKDILRLNLIVRTVAHRDAPFHEVTEDDLVVFEDRLVLPVDAEAGLQQIDDLLRHPASVLHVDQAVVVDATSFVYPEAHHLLWAVDA